MGDYLMPVDYQFSKGIDLPNWVWMKQHPVTMLVSNAIKYDGTRYIYVIQATTFYRFDTWTNAWQNLATPTSGGAGEDMVYDSVRNVVIIIHGLNALTWQVFNLNTTAVTIAGVVCQPWVFTTMTPVLPTGAGTGASLTRTGNYDEGDLVASGIAGATGQTTTNVNASTNLFHAQIVGLQLRVTSGAQSGQARLISAVVGSKDVTLDTSLPGALASTDTFVIERPGGTATAGTTITLTSPRTMIVNKYTNWDVEILSGTGAGQRRRIASNTTTVLTLATAVTGNPRTGAFATAPDATSVFRIIPSTDFIYYQNGVSGFYKLDIVASPASTWTTLATTPATLGAGATGDFSRFVAPGHIYFLRAVGTSTIYTYDIALNTFATQVHYPAPLETFTTGASMCILPAKNKLIVLKDASQRVLALDLATGLWETMGNHPFAAGAALEGKRIEIVTTADGATFLYLLRAGGQEWFRIALEWL